MILRGVLIKLDIPPKIYRFHAQQNKSCKKTKDISC